MCLYFIIKTNLRKIYVFHMLSLIHNKGGEYKTPAQRTRHKRQTCISKILYLR